MKQFNLSATAKCMVGGVEYMSSISEVVDAENSGQVTAEYEALWAMVYRTLQLAQKNMPKGNVAQNKVPSAAADEQPKPPAGTEFIIIDSWSVKFSEKGDRYITLNGGRYRKFGVVVYPERLQMIAAMLPEAFDLSQAPAGVHPVKGYQMLVTRTGAGNVTLNDVRPL